MRIAVFITGHEIADTVAHAVANGLAGDGRQVSYCTTDRLDLIDEADICIGYGILRGMDDVFRACQKVGKPFFHIDKGYFKPNHYDGYYRVSLNGTQQTFGFDKLKPDYERWDALGAEVLPASQRRECSLVCPATEPVSAFFGEWDMPWVTEDIIYRDKQFQGIPLQQHLDACNRVITFNSSVGWEALRQGIPVTSDPYHSIVGAYVKHFEERNKVSFDKSIQEGTNSRRDLFALMSSLQLTLNEMREGKLWELMSRLLSTSVMTEERQSLHTLQPTASAQEPAKTSTFNM